MDISRPNALLLLLIALCALMILSNEQVHAGKLSEQLISAAELGDIDTVKKILEQGVPVEAMDEDGWTALMKATYEGHGNIVGELLSRGARVDTQENAGWTSLMMAAQFGYREIAKALLEKGARIDIQNST
ncbi:MAG: ankyrin repeat domain-containing protein, partial [Desulfobacterales bacterium]|nr:ankyrin repeat domain-containing protein [Desulfobacterales bacterium]